MNGETRPGPVGENGEPAALGPARRHVTRQLVDVFTGAGEELYLVGGIVRDALLGRPLPSDLDFATSALPERTLQLGNEAGAVGSYLVGERFGTVGLAFTTGGEEVNAEITTYRHEHYPNQTRFPTVELGGQLHDDLGRRDFTVNAIAMDPGQGGIIDPFDGQADIARAIIRAVGNPELRFTEDPLRLLRAARLVSQLGFRIEPETAAAMRRNGSSLERISKERIFAELTKLLVGPYVEHALQTLAETGLLTIAMPHLEPLAAEAVMTARHRAHREKDLWPHTLLVVRQSPARPIARWAALLHDAAKPATRHLDANGEVSFIGHEQAGARLAGRLLRQLKADKATIQAVERLVELHGRPATYDTEWSDSAVRRLALDAGDGWDDLLDLAAADVTSGREHRRQLAGRRIQQLRAHFDRLQAEADLAELQSPLDGTELMALFGRGPGAWIKPVKDRLRDLVIDGEIKPDDKVAAERIARELVSES
ncbi:MAG: HD domain-containing protein [Chloroflexia bacterium]|nr:HD domain-containing protein [Chloroflexia bacterium]